MNRGMWLAGAVAGLTVLGLMGGNAIAQPADGLLLSEEGALAEGDLVLPTDNSLYDQYTFEGQEGQSVTITLESDEFDSYVALIGPDWEGHRYGVAYAPGSTGYDRYTCHAHLPERRRIFSVLA